MTREEQERFIQNDQDGLPNVRLRDDSRGYVVFTVPQGYVNPRSVQLYKFSIYSFAIRGVSYYARAVKRAELSPGTIMTLRRERDNQHDPNAVAILAKRSIVGYVNKLNAKRLAKRMDAGERFSAVMVRGSIPGVDSGPYRILITTPQIMAQMTSGVEWPPGNDIDDEPDQESRD